MSITQNGQSFSELFYYYASSGVIESGIQEDGGIKCYNQIPKTYHMSVMAILSLVHIIILYKYSNILLKGKLNKYDKQKDVSLLTRAIQVFVSLVGIVTLVLIFIMKIKTRKAAFILNPCHTSLIIQIYLILAQKNNLNKKIHTAWCSWIYGAILALLAPHSNGVTEIQIVLFYIQHFLIFPLGIILLYKYYGFNAPNLFEHAVGFCTVVIYQYVILGTAAIITMVNLNFILCHTPTDLWIDYYGYNYFIVGIFVLGIFSFISKIIIWLFICLFEKFTENNKEKIK